MFHLQISLCNEFSLNQEIHLMLFFSLSFLAFWNCEKESKEVTENFIQEQNVEQVSMIFHGGHHHHHYYQTVDSQTSHYDLPMTKRSAHKLLWTQDLSWQFV